MPDRFVSALYRIEGGGQRRVPGLITSRWFVDGIGQEGCEKVKAGYEQTTPLARVCSPEDVADAIIWLIDGAGTATGELMLLDSGIHLGKSPRIPAATKSAS